MKELAALLLLCAGCDVLWSIDHVDPAPLDATEPCPTSYTSVPGTPPASLYYFGMQPTPWDGAEGSCVAHTRTRITHLVVFDDINELQALRSFIDTSQVYTGFARDVSGPPDQFYAVTGEPLRLDSPIWGVGEPNNKNGTYPETATLFSKDFLLVDSPAVFQLPYLCECDGKPATRMFQTQ